VNVSKKGKKYYDSINNLPVFLFDTINKTSDFTYLMIDPDQAIPKNVNLFNVWADIYDEFIDEFGNNEKFEDWIRTRKRAVKLMREAYIDGKEYLITIAEATWREADMMMEAIEGGGLTKTSAIISKYMGFRINPMEITTAEFYSYFYLAQKSNGKSRT